MSVTPSRPRKTIRINYLKGPANRSFASLSVLGNPAEVRMSANNKQFISVGEKGITLAPGMGKSINLQLLPHNLRYGGLLMDLPFPLSIIPITPFTPFPKQIMVPPLLGLMPTLVQLGILTALFAA